MIKLPLLFTVCFFAAISAISQRNFNEFKNLKAEGDIPADFTTNAFSKIKEDIVNGNLELKHQEVFLEGVHYAINDLLHSGMVVYGDEVSNYVSEIADKLLANDKDLRNELRFYTIKSNETNAFSTYQGIIFVTTGLISQLTNEAQLAYVLSHEIAHYAEKHVVETFDLNQKNKRNVDKIAQLSNFSKDKEFEADRLGIKLYHQAGYSKSELISTFDVLLYSYLPFEEQEFSKTYLNSDLITIPEGYYPNKKFEIKAKEDSDDSNSSHPNIRKRKEAVEKELKNFKDWGNSLTLLGDSKFQSVRDVCRFESVRTDIVDAQFDDALYSIFILEKKYPESLYLKRMKAKAWLGVAQYKNTTGLTEKLPSTSDLEGEIASLQFLLKKLNKNQTITVAMRIVEDVRKQNPEDKVISAIWQKMVKTFGENEKFDLVKFSKKTYNQAYEDFKANKKDTAQLKTDQSSEGLNKYEKIKKQNGSGSTAELFDSTSFYLYAITDLMELKLFKETFAAFEEEAAVAKRQKDEYLTMTKKQKKQLEKRQEEEAAAMSVSSLIYLEPMVYSYSKEGVDRIKSEKLQIEYSSAVEEVSKDLGIKVTVLGTSSLINTGTDAFNDRSVLMSYFSEMSENEGIDVFPTDFDLLQDIQEKTGTSKVLLSVLQHEKSSKLNAGVIAASILFYPVMLYYVPNALLKSNQIELTALILDIESGKIENKFEFVNYESINKYTIGARVYNLLKIIQ